MAPIEGADKLDDVEEVTSQGSEAAMEDSNVAATSEKDGEEGIDTYEENEEEREVEETEDDERGLVSATDEEAEIDPEDLTKALEKIGVELSNEDFVRRLEHNASDQETFLQNYGRYIAKKPPPNQDNVLHFMARKRHTSTWLLTFMLSHYKERMDDQDDASRRPLTLAIQLKREKFVETVLESGYDDADLERILGLNKSDTGNGIHLAIKNDLDPKLTIRLTNKVSDEVLKDRDAAGCTPLHCAVEYKRCTESQLEVVKALMERGDSALDERTKVKNQSVYQYHLSKRPDEGTTAGRTGRVAPTTARVRQRAAGAPAPAPASNASQPASQESRDKKMDKREQKDTEKEEKEKKEKEGGNEIQAPPQTQTEDPEVIAPARRASTIKVGGGHQEVNLASTNSANYQANESRKAASAPQTQTKPQGGTRKTLSATAPRANRSSALNNPGKTATGTPTKYPGVTKASADRIAKEVKLQYLRSTFKDRDKPGQKERNHDSAVDFLYGDNQSKHICFNLLEREKFISQKSLTTGSYSRFVFDKALQFVAVRRLVFGKQTEPVVPEKGRRDMVTLFKWLHKKGVENIIKVIVYDNEDPSHSDEAIIEALSPFVVEILDWSKPDLCPEMIQKACNNVRELYLSWSGLNGMLLAWSDKDGLAKLPDLTDIYLCQTRYLESEDWTAKKLNQFETRLKESRDKVNAERKDKPLLPEIIVHRPKGPVKPEKRPTATAGQEQKKEPVFKDHQWLEIMDRFAAGIFGLAPDKYLNVPNLPLALERDVRICLIDDGVDIEHKSITDRMDGGRAFGVYPGDQYRGMTIPYYDSTTNHGTLMANMIARVCPYARIVSYRLDTRTGEDNRVHFTAKSAADALNHAASRDFDIISMSWTVKHERGSDENNSQDIARLNNALSEAAKKKLVFCSAPDTGNISTDELGFYYPVGSTITDKFFKIGAAKVDNNPWPPAGGRNIVDYILPGHEVCEKEGDEVLQANRSLKSGSSIATALAAGLAGLMMYIVRVAAIRTYQQKKEKEANAITLKSLNTIRSYATMRKTFNSMTMQKNGEMYVHVWGNFDRKGRELKAANDVSQDADEDEDPETKKWKIIAELARDLVSSKNEGETDQALEVDKVETPGA